MYPISWCLPSIKDRAAGFLQVQHELPTLNCEITVLAEVVVDPRAI